MSSLPSSRAGWSSIEITPPLGILLGGRGMVLSEADAIKAPLLAQVLVLEDYHGKRLVLVSLDLIGLSPSLSLNIRQRLSALSGALPDAVILSSSHTHSGPFVHFEDFATDEIRPRNLIEYESWLTEALVTGAAKALEELAPATVHRHNGITQIGINRRRTGPNGIVGAGPNPDGEYAPDLFLLSIVQPESGKRCIVFSAACHPIIDCGWNRTLISPDFPGATRDLLEQRLGAGTHVQFIQGACGNVRPRILSDFEKGQFRPCRPEDVEAVATELVGDVEKTLCSPGRLLELELKAIEERILFRMDEANTPDLATLAKGNNAPGHAARYWLERPRAVWSHWKPWPVGLISLAPDCRIAWTGGEPLSEWQSMVREWLSDPNLMLWGYIGEASGYLPADRHLPERGYETSTEMYRCFGPWPLAPGIDAAVEAGFRKMASALQ